MGDENRIAKAGKLIAAQNMVLMASNGLSEEEMETVRKIARDANDAIVAAAGGDDEKFYRLTTGISVLFANTHTGSDKAARQGGSRE